MIGIIKTDARYNYLHKLIDNSILSNDVLDFYNVDVLILPFKGIDEDGYIYGTKIKLAEILKNNCIKRIIVGNANNILKELCDKDIEIIELLKKDDFIKDNAFLTAKGCINYISNGASDISEFKILILGFGYISYYLCKILAAYNVDFNVIAMTDTEKKFVKLLNYNISNKIEANYDLIINTVPCNFDIDYSILKNIKIYDLASYPYGFDLLKIEENKIDYTLLSSVPAMYAPMTAARIIMKYIV